MIKLYEIPRNSKLYLNDKFLGIFEHIDGAYSYCIDELDTPFHLSASTSLEEFEDGYRIIIPHDTERSSVV